MSIRNAVATLAIALFAASVAAGAGAQQRREGPYAADVKKFCGDVKPGQGAIAKCMKAHEAELSPTCQEGMRARAEKAEGCARIANPTQRNSARALRPGAGESGPA